MTGSLQKRHERFFAEEAAQLMDSTWTIGSDRESPDFVVIEGVAQFGLEVSAIFTGEQDDKGSAMKKDESLLQRSINDIRRSYEQQGGASMLVRLVGDMSDKNMATILPALLSANLASMQVGYHEIIDQDNGLRIHVTRSDRADWFAINHRVGWVDRNPLPRIADAIQAKAERLAEYQKAAGANVRLLLVANRILNSGKLELTGNVLVDTMGFRKVYFLSYPESVTTFEGKARMYVR